MKFARVKVTILCVCSRSLCNRVPMATYSILALVAALIPTIALADISGPARVIDGDSIEIAGERIRIHGIDAPERSQTCLLQGRR